MCASANTQSSRAWLAPGESLWGHWDILSLGNCGWELGRRCGSLAMAPKESPEHVKHLHCLFFMPLLFFCGFHLFHPLPLPLTPKAGSAQGWSGRGWVFGGGEEQDLLGEFFSKEGQDVPALHHCCPVSPWMNNQARIGRSLRLLLCPAKASFLVSWQGESLATGLNLEWIPNIIPPIMQKKNPSEKILAKHRSDRLYPLELIHLPPKPQTEQTKTNLKIVPAAACWWRGAHFVSAVKYLLLVFLDSFGDGCLKDPSPCPGNEYY